MIDAIARGLWKFNKVRAAAAAAAAPPWQWLDDYDYYLTYHHEPGEDDTAPTVGPALTKVGTLVTTGAPAVGDCAYGDGSSYYYSASTSTDPVSGDDTIVAVHCSRYDDDGNQVMTGNRAAGDGFYFFVYNGAEEVRAAVKPNGGAEVVPTGPANYPEYGCWYVALLKYSNVANTVTIYVNGNPGTPAACAGDHLTGGDGIASYTQRTNAWPWNGYVHTIKDYHGSNIASVFTDAYVRQFTNAIMGLGDSETRTFTRAGPATFIANDTVHCVSTNYARVGDDGVLIEESARTNKCYRNFSFEDSGTTGYSISGGSGSWGQVDDSANMQGTTTNIGSLGPWVLEVENTHATANRYLINNGATGNTNAHSLALYARRTSGSGTAAFGIGEGSDALFVSASNLGTAATYDLTTGENITPATSANNLVVRIPPQTTYRMTGFHMEEGSTYTSIIPNYNTAASQIRGADSIA